LQLTILQRLLFSARHFSPDVTLDAYAFFFLGQLVFLQQQCESTWRNLGYCCCNMTLVGSSGRSEERRAKGKTIFSLIDDANDILGTGQEATFSHCLFCM
jgi:hypothetical protein